MVFSKRTSRRMDNIRDFCDFDPKSMTATLHLQFQSAEEIIDSRLSTVNAPVVSADAVELLEAYLEYVPQEFKVDYQLEIRDCKCYDPQKLEASFIKTMEIRQCSERACSKGKQSKMGVFVIVGLIMLLVVYVNSKFKWFAFAGLPVSAVIAFVLELIFELYFEEGMTYFAVSKLYDRFGETGRFGTIRIL